MSEEYQRGWNEALREVWQRVFPRKPVPDPLTVEVLEEAIETAMADRYDDGAQAASEVASYYGV